MTQLAQRRAEQEKQLATAGDEDLHPVQCGDESGDWSAGGEISMEPDWGKSGSMMLDGSSRARVDDMGPSKSDLPEDCVLSSLDEDMEDKVSWTSISLEALDEEVLLLEFDMDLLLSTLAALLLSLAAS